MNGKPNSEEVWFMVALVADRVRRSARMGTRSAIIANRDACWKVRL